MAEKAAKKPKAAKRKPTTKKKPKVKAAEFVVTEEFLTDVHVLAKYGMRQKLIADFYGLDAVEWAKVLKLHPVAAKSIRQGKAVGVNIAAGKLMELVQEGNLSAIMFYLKTQGQFSETMGNNLDPASAPDTVPRELPKDPREASKVYQQVMLGGKADGYSKG